MKIHKSLFVREYLNISEQFESMLDCLVCSVQLIVILNIVFGFCVIDCIWEHSLKMFFDIV